MLDTAGARRHVDDAPSADDQTPSTEPHGLGEPGDPREPARSGDPGGLGYQPALDGLRGLALLAIVVFHAQVAGVPGAFLSVSTFFTLSGFLITSVMLAQHRRTGSVAIRDFYGRRARRLLPAALVAVAAITVATVLLDDSTQLVRLRADGLASLLYVGNWRLVLAGDSYGAIFQSPSLFTHFWTLGIEEQFYLGFPLVVALVLAVGRGSRRVLAAAFAAGVVLSTAWSAVLVGSGTGSGIDRVYFGTDARLAELLVGCLAAVWWARAPRIGPRLARLLGAAGGAGLVAMLVLWHVADRTSTFFYRGGLVAYAGLTVVVILAAIQPGGPVRTVLAWRPLVFVGTVSYGAYLLHWPILVALRLRTSWSTGVLLVVGLALTMALAALSYRWIERPIRTGSWPAHRPQPADATHGGLRRSVRRPGVAAGASLVATAGLIVAVTVLRPAPAPAIDFDAASDELAAFGATTGPVDEATREAQEARRAALSPEERERLDEYTAQQERIAASTAPRVAFFGDSTSLMTGLGVTNWAVDHLDQLAPAPSQPDMGCGLLGDAPRREAGVVTEPPPECTDRLDRWEAQLKETTVDIAVVQFGPWDVHDQQLDPDGPFLTIGDDPTLDDALRDELDDEVALLLDHTQVVVLIAGPDVTFGRVDGRDPRRARAESDPARMARFRRLVGEVAARHPRVAVVDLAGFVAGRDDDAEMRPDGVHFTDASSATVAAWLAPEIVRAYDEHAPPSSR
ncbi:MAG TPA: acyltransferase family protein [Acidimicrobiales bacterium]|nr:acyltransferase family protein [Acidimicrobiales bacterium]